MRRVQGGMLIWRGGDHLSQHVMPGLYFSNSAQLAQTLAEHAKAAEMSRLAAM